MKQFIILLFICFSFSIQAQNASNYVGVTSFLKDVPPLNALESDFSYRNFLSGAIGIVYRKNLKRQTTQHLNYWSNTSARLHFYLETQANYNTNGYAYRFAQHTYRMTYQTLEVPLLLTFRSENVYPITTFWRRKHLCLVGKIGLIFVFQATETTKNRSIQVDKDWGLEEKLIIYKGVYPAFSYQAGMEKVFKNKQILQATLGGHAAVSKRTTFSTINGTIAGVPFSESFKNWDGYFFLSLQYLWAKRECEETRVIYNARQL